jgi:putative addiction module component (TIGR02574 family)
MSRALEDLESEILNLDLGARATLAERLLDSLENLSDEEYEQLWADEAEHRLARYESAQTVAIDGDEVFARLRRRNQ